MDSNFLTDDDIAQGNNMMKDYSEKKNLNNEQNAFIALWSNRDHINDSQAKLLKSLIKVYRQEKRLINAKIKSNERMQRDKKQQIKNAKERSYKLLKLITDMDVDKRAYVYGVIIYMTMDPQTGFSDAVDLLLKNDYEKREFIKKLENLYDNDDEIRAITHAVETTYSFLNENYAPPSGAE